MEVPKNVLPDSSPATPEDGENMEPVTPSVVTPPAPVVPPVPPVTPPVTPPPAPGSQTPPENLLAALQNERSQSAVKDQKIQELEAEVIRLQTTPEPPLSEPISDEGKLLNDKIQTLETEISSLKEEKVVEALHAQYPVLKDLAPEFNQYKTAFPGVAVERVVKLFLNEKGLLDPMRKGLERPTSGGGTPPSDKLSSEQISDLRKNNWRKYTELLQNGTIRLDDLG